MGFQSLWDIRFRSGDAISAKKERVFHMEKQRLFIGGSKRLKKIEGTRCFDVIDAAMQNGFEILVGDCQGVDTIVQK